MKVMGKLAKSLVLIRLVSLQWFHIIDTPDEKIVSGEQGLN